LGKSVHLNRPGKKHNSGFGLSPTAVTKIKLKKEINKEHVFIENQKLIGRAV